jgi:hypothetical protein
LYLYATLALSPSHSHSPWRGWVVACVNYLAIMACCAGWWIAAPESALVAFLAVSAHHFGEAEGDAIAFTRHGHQTLFGLSRGLLVIGALLASDPEAGTGLPSMKGVTR